jgi:acyl-CoA synthetase (NDP forming)
VSLRGLDALLAPSSVVVIGASDDPRRIGGRPLSYLLSRGFAGRVLAVNPKRETVQGLPALASLDDAPETPDLAIVAVPAATALATLEDCAARGVGAAVVFSSGFAEVDDDGGAGQRAMADVARASGMRILGPNCLGLYNAGIGLYATFTSTIEVETPLPGPVGVVSQSGAYGSHVAYLARRRRVQAGYLLTTGNECDVEAAECIEWLAGRDDVKVIAACAEGLRDGDALVAALEAARRARKPVVFLKMGRSAAGAEAARTHTAALAGSDAVYDAVFRELGVHRACDTDELLDVAYAASFGILPRSSRLGLISVSGGMGIQMADAAERHGLPLAPMPEATQARLRRRVPFAATRNPVDTTAQVLNEMGLVEEFLEAMLEEGGYDAVVAFFTYVASAASMGPQLAEIMLRARERHPDRLLVQSILAPEDVIARYEAAGCPCFENPDRAVRAVAALARFAAAVERTPARLGALPAPVVWPAGELDEADTLALLAGAGLPAPVLRRVASAGEAAQAAAELGFPVALKVCSPDLAHKSDAGGVRLGLADAAAVRAAFESVRADVARSVPGARVEGALVVPMAADGVDLVLGARRDPLFGPVVLAGIGGVFVEVLQDVSLRRAPVDAATAREMLESLRGWPLLAGARGRAPADVAAACDAIVSLSRFAAANAVAVSSVDVNPLRVFPEGACMLDALVERAGPRGG